MHGEPDHLPTAVEVTPSARDSNGALGGSGWACCSLGGVPAGVMPGQAFGWVHVTVIAHLSDPHLDTSSGRLERLRRVVGEVEALEGVELMLVSGDLANHGSAEEYAQFFAVLPTSVPTLVVPGNHDHRESLRRYLPPGNSTKGLNAVVTVGGVTIIGLDTLIEGSDAGVLDAETLAFAERHIDAAPGLVLLAMHHPPVPVGHALMDQFGLGNPDDLAALVSRRDVVAACLTGHVHTALATTFAGRPLVGAPGIVSTMRLGSKTDPIADGNAVPGFALHHLGASGHLSTIFHYLSPE